PLGAIIFADIGYDAGEKVGELQLHQVVTFAGALDPKQSSGGGTVGRSLSATLVRAVQNVNHRHRQGVARGVLIHGRGLGMGPERAGHGFALRRWGTLWLVRPRPRLRRWRVVLGLEADRRGDFTRAPGGVTPPGIPLAAHQARLSEESLHTR